MTCSCPLCDPWQKLMGAGSLAQAVEWRPGEGEGGEPASVGSTGPSQLSLRLEHWPQIVRPTGPGLQRKDWSLQGPRRAWAFQGPAGQGPSVLLCRQQLCSEMAHPMGGTVFPSLGQRARGEVRRSCFCSWLQAEAKAGLSVHRQILSAQPTLGT